MVIVEKSFPRGGETVSKEAPERKPEQIFGAVQRKIKKNKTKNTTLSVKDNDELALPRSAELLNYDTIQDGMLIMGLVKNVDQLYLTITLPGRLSARVSALEVSDAYTKSMKEFLENSVQSEVYKPLNELYRVGKIVYGRIKEIKQGAKAEVQIDMTLKPKEVHAELVHDKIRKGFVFNGAVEEIQEHGYIIESGIKGLRCFLPAEKSGLDHTVGELIYLKVEKVTADKSVSTCICAEIKPNKFKIRDQNNPNLDYLLPSTIVNFQVRKLLKNGLQGSIMNELYTAYVNEHQLSDPLTLPEDYEVNAKYEARILYVMPLTKFVYLTLNVMDIKTNKSEDDKSSADLKLKPGDIIENAKVHHLGTGGVVLILKDKLKGIISYNTIKANYKGNYDQDELLSKYAKKSKHTVRIMNYDIMDSLYICTDDSTAIKEKYFSFEDIKPGDFVTATVKEINHKIGGYYLHLGKINALIEKLFLAPSAKNLDPKSKLKCRVVYVNPERKLVYLTNRYEYMSKSSKLLVSLEEAKINVNYVGTVVNCTNTFALVKFFGDVKGVFFKQSTTPDQFQNMEVGQTMQFRVASIKDNQLVLGLVENAFKLGEICPVSVVNRLDSGLEIKISYSTNDGEDFEQKGLIPVRLLSDYVDLLKAKLHLYPINEEMQAVCIYGNVFSLRDVKYFSNHLTCNWKSVGIGNILRSYVKDVNEDVVEFVVPIQDYKKTVKVHLKMMLMNAFNDAHIELSPDQVIYVKVLGKDDTTKNISLTAKLTDVWDCKMSSTADRLESYLTEVSEIKKLLKKQNNAIARYSPGDKVTAKFQCVNEVNHWEYVINGTEVIGIVKSSVVGKLKPPKEGTEQECVVLWIDYSNMLVYLTNKIGDLDHISTDQKIPTNLIGKSGINGKVLFKNESVFVCSLKKGKNPLVFCPTQLHFNDFEYTASKKVVEGQFCKLAFIHETHPIAVLDDIYKLWHEINRKRKLNDNEKSVDAVEAKKQRLDTTKKKEAEESEQQMNYQVIEVKSNKKLQEVRNKNKKQSETKIKKEIDKKKLNISETKTEQSEKCNKSSAKKNNTQYEYNSSASENDETMTDSILFYEDKGPDKKAAAQVVEKEITNLTSDNNITPPRSALNSLMGVKDFWNLDLNNISTIVQSSDDDDDDSNESDKKPRAKKKLTAVEKFKQQREEEARLRAIEEKYADPNQLPDSVDQYDRLVLSDPNNSKHWINYMVFHLQSTEVDKARAVARRALKTITFRSSDDLINIWVALLNLELRYGSKETFNDTLKEALICNEPLKIYLRAIDIFTDAKKTAELFEIIGTVTKKFKTAPEVWQASANAFFEIGMTERAQQLLHKALASLPERDHVNTIVMFANLNHKHGNNEMAQTLLDQVVTSYPKRVDVWCQYVDMLVKQDLIDSARNILERAVIQKIPLRKMRTVFKKYLEFEDRFGNDANVQRVKLLAMEYVKKNENL